MLQIRKALAIAEAPSDVIYRYIVRSVVMNYPFAG